VFGMVVEKEVLGKRIVGRPRKKLGKIQCSRI